MTETIVKQLKTIIAVDLDVNLEVNDIDEDITLEEDGLGLDSMALVEFIALVEEKFEFMFSESELSPDVFSSLKVLATFIDSKLANDA